MGNNIEDLFSTHWLAILTQMKTLTVYHVSDLLSAHSSIGRGQTINYGFLNLHKHKFMKNL